MQYSNQSIPAPVAPVDVAVELGAPGVCWPLLPAAGLDPNKLFLIDDMMEGRLLAPVASPLGAVSTSSIGLPLPSAPDAD